MVTAIVGGNWGDEGKGKMTDLLASKADFVVRFQGGANAGHTIINEFGKHVLRLLPSGVFRPSTVNIIAQGVAFDPAFFFAELEKLEKSYVPRPQVYVSERAQLAMPYHRLFDEAEEERLGLAAFGSTKSGIAPFYSDKCLKINFCVAELYDGAFPERLRAVCEVKNRILKAVYGFDDARLPDADAILEQYLAYAERLAPYVADTSSMLREAVKNRRNILLEGQLGALRDPDNGIYPFTTSSSPLAGAACAGAGIPPYEIRRVVAVVKAYSSCVGAGAFVTELFGPEGDELRMRGGDGGEYGAATGRPRRMGWFDAVASRYGARLQGATEIALSLLDVLSYLGEIPVCTEYEIDGRRTEVFPVTPLLNRAKPVYTVLPGWKKLISGVRRYEDLPDNARRYVEFVEEKLGVPVKMISNGPRREDIILRG